MCVSDRNDHVSLPSEDQALSSWSNDVQPQ